MIDFPNGGHPEVIHAELMRKQLARVGISKNWMPKRKRSDNTASTVADEMVQSNGDAPMMVADAFETSLQDIRNSLPAYDDSRKIIVKSDKAGTWYSHAEKSASEVELRAAVII
ncbi:hypothetical protein LTS18_013025 [Coniosporium uncinatum]|uniref:Uncharacterized protein n=1 Tax=Coniosporium uncinatum TaxID=93489 RepID=A0ACC3DIB4_9PEZI|nr:hypothetical protein LTS18_013025 [Coniosporium uncinatum]